ncbi:hypothetical protein TUSST3_15060 [Streptomyces sp. TUS-ST3]|nr:hypothetical protein TUSST3_15060 [Streptomyces sp. TUS-ST3]
MRNSPLGLRSRMPRPARLAQPGGGCRPPADGSGAAPYDRVRAAMAAADPTDARGPGTRGASGVASRAAPSGGPEAEEPVEYTGPLGARGLVDRAVCAPGKE